MGFGLYMINELRINGQTVDDNDDFNIENDTQTDAEKQNDNPDDIAQNAANNAAEDQQDAIEAEPQQDDTPAEDTGNDPEDDFTIDDTDEADTTATESDDGEDATTDAEDGTDDGANDDFTVTGDEDGGEEVSNSGDDEQSSGGDDTTQQTNSAQSKQGPADPTDNIDDDEDRAAEEAIYDSLTDDQKRIRALQLKLDYKDLYETMTTTIEGINGIPKNSDNIESIKRLIMLLTKARNIIIDYLENNFDSNPYLENYTMYIKYMAVFRTASKVIEEINLYNK